MEEREMYFEIFRKDFNKSNEAKKYLSSRNLSSKIYNDSQIGFCIAESTYKFSLLKGRLIVPIRNVHGELIAMAGTAERTYNVYTFLAKKWEEEFIQEGLINLESSCQESLRFPRVTS